MRGDKEQIVIETAGGKVTASTQQGLQSLALNEILCMIIISKPLCGFTNLRIVNLSAQE